MDIKEEFIRKISKICQNTPELDINKNLNEEAQRLDIVLWQITRLCDDFLDELKKVAYH